MFSFGHCPNYFSPPTPPDSGNLYHFFGRQNNVLECITEPSNNDYDNDGIDNCDHDFGTFDDFGVKYDPPPHSDNVRKKNSFSSGRCSLREHLPWKNVSFWGGGPCPKFFTLFPQSTSWSIKRAFSSKLLIIWTQGSWCPKNGGGGRGNLSNARKNTIFSWEEFP